MTVRRPGAHLLATAALVAVTAVWGSTFVLIKDLLDRLPVADFLAVRFVIAAVVMAAVAPRSVASLPSALRRRGVLLGLLYGAAQLLQTAGLGLTSASVSGFLTGMYVVLTPLFGTLLLRQRIPASTWAAVGLATVGMAVLSLRGWAFGPGESLTVAAAAVYALHILGLGRWSRPGDAYGLAVVQMAVIAAVCTLGALPGGIELPATTGDWVAMVYMALVAGALALVVQTWAQAHLAPTRAAIVMTTEPVFAAAFAVALGGEDLTVRLVVGGALVLGAMLLAELRGAAPVGGEPAGLPVGADPPPR